MPNWKKALIACAVSMVTAFILGDVISGFMGWLSCMAFYITFEFLEYVREDKK